MANLVAEWSSTPVVLVALDLTALDLATLDSVEEAVAAADLALFAPRLKYAASVIKNKPYD